MATFDPCAWCEEVLQPYLDRNLTERERVEAQAHLDRGKRLYGEGDFVGAAAEFTLAAVSYTHLTLPTIYSV